MVSISGLERGPAKTGLWAKLLRAMQRWELAPPPAQKAEIQVTEKTGETKIVIRPAGMPARDAAVTFAWRGDGALEVTLPKGV